MNRRTPCGELLPYAASGFLPRSDGTLLVSVSASAPSDADRLFPFRTGETRWDAAPRLLPALFGTRGLRLAEWEAAGLVDVVKHGPHRTVSRLRLPEGTFYLKHYRLADWRARLQNAVRPCRALREWTAARHVTNAGIRTFETVAVGRTFEGKRVGDSFLLTRAIENTEPLHDFFEERLRTLPAAQQGRLRRAIARQLGELVARLHARGLLHRDLHAGNILLQIGPDDEVELWLIDLHAVEARRRVSSRQARANIALLGHFFARHATRADRLRFFHAYRHQLDAAGCRLFAGRPKANVARDFETYCTRATQRAYRSGDRKWQRPNRRLIFADGHGVQCRGLSELGRERIESLRDNPEQLFPVPGLRRPQAVPALTRTARVSLWIDGARRSAMAVARETTSWRDRLRHWIGRSPLRVAWEAGHALLRRGIEAPRPLLWISRCEGGILREYLLLEAADGRVPLLDLPHEEIARRPFVRRRPKNFARSGEPTFASRR